MTEKEYVLLDDGNIAVKEIVRVIDINKLREEKEILEKELKAITTSIAEIDNEITQALSLLEPKKEISLDELEAELEDTLEEELEKEIDIPLPPPPAPPVEEAEEVVEAVEEVAVENIATEAKKGKGKRKK